MKNKNMLPKFLTLELKLERCDRIAEAYRERSLMSKVEPRNSGVLQVKLERLESIKLEPDPIAGVSLKLERLESIKLEPDPKAGVSQENNEDTPDMDVCWGCLEEGELQDMHIPFNQHDDTYADLLSYCFSLQVVPDVKAFKRKFFMCMECITRLQEAVKFKRQLEVAKSFFNRLFLEQDNEENPAACDSPIVIDDDGDVIKKEQHSHNGMEPIKKSIYSADGNGEQDIGDNSEVMKPPHCKFLDQIKFEKHCRCPICMKTFLTIQRRRQHLRTDHDVDNINRFCEECGKCFTTVGHLGTHVRSVHLEERPYQCVMCTCAFFRLQGLKRHMDLKHPTANPYKSNFGCKNCSRVFQYLGELKEHRKFCTVPMVQEYECFNCRKRFSSIESIQTHKMTCKSIQAYPGRVPPDKYHCKKCNQLVSSALGEIAHREVCWGEVVQTNPVVQFFPVEVHGLMEIGPGPNKGSVLTANVLRPKPGGFQGTENPQQSGMYLEVTYEPEGIASNMPRQEPMDVPIEISDDS